jgi:hypothetical protein
LRLFWGGARRFSRAFAISAVLAATALAPSVSFAQVIEPNGVSVPGPSSNMGETPLATYFTSIGEGIDAVADAAYEPGTFSPLCDFDATYVLGQSQGQAGMGWYNVPASDTAAIPFADLHVLITPDVMPGAMIFAEDIRNDPAYEGGFIGFALYKNFGNGPNVTPTIIYYSEYMRNAFCTNCDMPDYWKMALVYRSTLDTSTYFIAFEDWEGADANDWKGNDGDFNDKVFRLHGISCAGGGLPCEIPGKIGRCAAGLTECQTVGGGTPTCKQIIEEQPEICDDTDNDCNGEIDDGDLCPTDHICVRGTCVRACNTGEFQCDVGLSCDSGYCVDPDCVDVECEVGDVCRDGTCVNSCTGIVCPVGQDCIDGRCIAACAGVECAAGSVCDRGVCVGLCSCTGCPTGKECAADGLCVEPGCEDVMCGAGETCVDGACVDVCQPAVCPGGAECTNGMCGEPTGTGGSSGAGGARGGSGGAVIQGGNGGVTGNGANAGVIVSGNSGAGGGQGDDDELGSSPKGDPGCACRAVPSRPGYLSFAGIGLGLLLFARRRARGRRAL